MVPRVPEDPPRLRVPPFSGANVFRCPGHHLFPVLEQFLFADCCDEFLEVERFEICDVFEVSFAECLDGRGEH